MLAPALDRDARHEAEHDDVGVEGKLRSPSPPSWSGLTRPSMNTASLPCAWTLGSSPRVTGVGVGVGSVPRQPRI